MKTKEELLALKEEYDRLNTLLQELSEDELREVTGGYGPLLPIAIPSLQSIDDKRLIKSFPSPEITVKSNAEDHNVMLPDRLAHDGAVLITGKEPPVQPEIFPVK